MGVIRKAASSVPPKATSIAFGPRPPLAPLAALVVAYGFSQFFRSFIAVIAPELAVDLRVSSAELGGLSSVYFGCSALAQIPLGIALDRFGAGRTVALSLAFAAVSAFAFSRAETLAVAMVAQGALGVACAPLLMALMYFIGLYYPQRRFLVVSSVAGALGLVGNLVAASPFGWLTHAMGWRQALAVAAVSTAAAAAIVQWQIRDRATDAGEVEPPGQILRNTVGVLALRSLWPMIPMCLVATGVALTFRTVWGGPYLARVFGLDMVARGNILSVISLGGIGAAILAAVLGRHYSARSLALWSTAAAVVSLLLLALVPDVDAWLCGGLLTAATFFGAVHTHLMADGRSRLPARFVGRGLGLLNFFVFLGIGAVNAAVGLILDYWPVDATHASQAYRVVFIALAAVLTAALAVYAMGRSPKTDTTS